MLMEAKDHENRSYHAGDLLPQPDVETGMPRRLEGTAQTDFGARLAELRQAAGYSQRELASELGISQRMVAYYEGETDYPPAGILSDLARVLGVSVDQILGTKLVRSATKKPQDTRLWRRFKQVEKLPAKERRQLLQLIDTFLDREKLRGNGAR
jgi:transcriptional regulator with XRE-family HTH domain